MSAFGGKADIALTCRFVRYWSNSGQSQALNNNGRTIRLDFIFCVFLGIACEKCRGRGKYYSGTPNRLAGPAHAEAMTPSANMAAMKLFSILVSRGRGGGAYYMPLRCPLRRPHSDFAAGMGVQTAANSAKRSSAVCYPKLYPKRLMEGLEMRFFRISL
jgi:hypothetical protein